MRIACTWDHVVAMRKSLTPYMSKGRVFAIAGKGEHKRVALLSCKI